MPPGITFDSLSLGVRPKLSEPDILLFSRTISNTILSYRFRLPLLLSSPFTEATAGETTEEVQIALVSEFIYHKLKA